MWNGLSIGENALEPSINLYGILGAVGMGISLGVFGAGGSILTMPIFVYLYSVQAVLATQLSLFVVGMVSLSGILRNRTKISFQASLRFTFGILLGMAAMRKLILPSIPKEFLGTSLDTWILATFAVVMVLASISMLFVKLPSQVEEAKSGNRFFLFLLGVFTGLLTGFVGAGGGFLIVPALVFFAGMPMHSATATSLLVIALNSLVGFAFSSSFQGLPWGIILEVLGFSLIGMQLGQRIAKFLPAQRLKQGFGVFVLIMGIYIFTHSIGS